MEKRYKISEAARLLGCSPDWLRDAERDRRISPSRKDSNGWRVYSASDLDLIEKLLLPDRISTPTPTLTWF